MVREHVGEEQCLLLPMTAVEALSQASGMPGCGAFLLQAIMPGRTKILERSPFLLQYIICIYYCAFIFIIWRV